MGRGRRHGRTRPKPVGRRQSGGGARPRFSAMPPGPPPAPPPTPPPPPPPGPPPGPWNPKMQKKIVTQRGTWFKPWEKKKRQGQAEQRGGRRAPAGGGGGGKCCYVNGNHYPCGDAICTSSNGECYTCPQHSNVTRQGGGNLGSLACPAGFTPTADGSCIPG